MEAAVTRVACVYWCARGVVFVCCQCVYECVYVCMRVNVCDVARSRFFYAN